jgi:gliding motility-associated-like protein
MVAPITAIGDSLKWYTSLSGTGSFVAPVPTVTSPGITTYYVTQYESGCESQKAALTVTVYVLPDFEIAADRDWVCQFDSLQLRYDGPAYVNPGYAWQLPIGSDFVSGTKFDDKDVMVRFDTVWGRHIVRLTVSNYDGRCWSMDTMPIRVIPAPDAHAYIKPDVCLGDTITLALTTHTSNSHTYTWMLDGNPMFTSPKINVISSNINSGGPYVISWNDSGLHIINVKSSTAEGCTALPTADTVKVHTLPDSRFNISQIPAKFCVEDSVLFTAVKSDYSYSYKWEPEHSFVNQNKPEAWGRVELVHSRIMLTVTDPFGCRSSYSKAVNPDECCNVAMPNAFTPNGDGKNDRFRPIFDGYRRFHMFRITNRWGQTVFESANSNPSWDGTFNGNMLDMGTYFFYLKYDCGGKALEAKGDVILVR